MIEGNSDRMGRDPTQFNGIARVGNFDVSREGKDLWRRKGFGNERDAWLRAVGMIAGGRKKT